MSIFSVRLPVEIIEIIFSYIPERDFPSCCLVNRTCNSLCAPYLYRNISLNLFHLLPRYETWLSPKDSFPDVPSPRQNVISSFNRILSAGTTRTTFLLSSVKNIEVYGLVNLEGEELHNFEAEVSILLTKILQFTPKVERFVWDLELSPSTALLVALQSHPTVNSIFLTTACPYISYEGDYPDDADGVFDGRYRNPSFPFQNPDFDPAAFKNLVVLGIDHIGNWGQVESINSVICACVRTIRCLCLKACGSCDCEFSSDRWMENDTQNTNNANVLCSILSVRETGERLKLRELEIEEFQFHDDAGENIDLSVLESFAVQWARGPLKHFWGSWEPRTFPGLKRFRFSMARHWNTHHWGNGDMYKEELESLVDLVSRVPNGLEVFELMYDGQVVPDSEEEEEGEGEGEAGELGLWTALLDGLRKNSGKTLKTLVLQDQSGRDYGEGVREVRDIIIQQFTEHASEWERLETLLAEPVYNEWDTFLSSISGFPSLTTVLMHNFRPYPAVSRGHGDYIYRQYGRPLFNRFGRLEIPDDYVEYNTVIMADASHIASFIPHIKYIGIRTAHPKARSFYRHRPETGVVQIDEDEFAELTGLGDMLRWIRAKVDKRVWIS